MNFSVLLFLRINRLLASEKGRRSIGNATRGIYRYESLYYTIVVLVVGTNDTYTPASPTSLVREDSLLLHSLSYLSFLSSPSPLSLDSLYTHSPHVGFRKALLTLRFVPRSLGPGADGSPPKCILSCLATR